MSAVNERWTALFPDADNRPTYKFVPADLPENRVVALEYFAVLGATRQVINIENVAHTNPIPMGVRMGKYIFSSRVLPMDPQTGKYPPDVALQMDVLFGNLDAVLNAGGMTWSNIAQGRLFLADMDNLSAVQRRWAAQFSDTLAPPLHPLEYTAGPLLVMIEFVAVQA
jgi:2-iminobutanoate/2-iminopropanoate deaminase